MRFHFQGPRDTSRSLGPDPGLTWASPVRVTAHPNGSSALLKSSQTFVKPSKVNQHLWAEMRGNGERNQLAGRTFSDAR